MATTKRIICLANSRKLQGRCIAGKEVVNSKPVGWVRPVSEREHEEVSEYERQYEDGSDPKVLDIMDIPLISHRPKLYQKENWLLDPQIYWRKAGKVTWSDLAPLADPKGPLWLNGNSTYNGLNDQISSVPAAGLQSSLHFFKVDTLTLSVFCPGEAFGNPKRRVQAQFIYAGCQYRLWVTDPVYERNYLAMQNGSY